MRSREASGNGRPSPLLLEVVKAACGFDKDARDRSQETRGPPQISIDSHKTDKEYFVWRRKHEDDQLAMCGARRLRRGRGRASFDQRSAWLITGACKNICEKNKLVCRRESDEFQRAAWTQEREVGHFNLELPWHVRRLLHERVRSPSLGVLKQTPKGLQVVLEKRFVFPLVGG